MRGRYILLAMAAAILLEVSAAVLASTEVVPVWRSVRDGLALGLVALSVTGGLLAWVLGARQRGFTPARVLAGGLLALLLVAGGWLTLSLRSTDEFGLRSRRLVQSMDLSDEQGELYVYEYEGVPDGFEETVVMMREGSLPVMRPLVATRYRVGSIVQEGAVLRMRLEESAENPVLQCDLATRACW
jgi:hypothetical protein